MGGIGTGKTALTKRFGMNFEQVAKQVAEERSPMNP